MRGSLLATLRRSRRSSMIPCRAAHHARREGHRRRTGSAPHVPTVGPPCLNQLYAKRPEEAVSMPAGFLPFVTILLSLLITAITVLIRVAVALVSFMIGLVMRLLGLGIRLGGWAAARAVVVARSSVLVLREA